MHVSTLSLQSCPTLCSPMDSSPPGSLVHGILLARILEWLDPGIEPMSLTSLALTGGFFITSATWEARICSLYTLILTTYQDVNTRKMIEVCFVIYF